MTGIIELDRDGQHLLIRFPYREDLVDEVRGLPGRRWDRNQKVWRVPATHAEHVVSTMMRHGFEVTAEVSSIVAGTTVLEKPAAAPPREHTRKDRAPARPAPVAAEPLSVSTLNGLVRDALQGAFPGRVQVIGEVLDFDKTRDRQHLFFSLVEKAAGGQQVAAAVEVALFERTAQRVLATLEAAGLTLRDGIEILVEARIDLYPATGRFQLIIENVRPEFTLGKLLLSREQILAELRREGLERRNLDLPVPVPPLRIGVLCSPDSDGWNDFHKEVEASGIGFTLTLYPIKVQGELLRPTILAGLRWFVANRQDHDVVCIVRGGGSRSDLAGFDDKDVALAVARHPLKVLCGIGHERDRSVLDLISHSLKTPSATAAFLVAQVCEARDRLVARGRELRQAARSAFAANTAQLTGLAQRLYRLLHGRMIGERRALAGAAARLRIGTRGLLRGRRDALERHWVRIRAESGGQLRGERLTLAAAARRLEHAGPARVRQAHAALAAAATRQRLLDPARVLSRGYTVVRDLSGRIVTGIDGLRPGTAADVVFRDGRARAQIESVHPIADRAGIADTPPGRKPAPSPRSTRKRAETDT